MKKNLFYLLLMASVFLIACEEKSPDSYTGEIQINEKDREISVDENSHSLNIQFTSEAWKAHIEGTDAHWINISPDHGEGGTSTIELDIAANTSNQGRSAILKITAGDAEAEIKISQEYKGNDNEEEEEPEEEYIEIPDENFQRHILKNYDINGDGRISVSEAEKITDLTVCEMGIKDLSGIEFMHSLRTLDCNNNNITELDLSQNTALLNLYCNVNGLKKLDISGCTALQGLYLNFNELSTLELPAANNLYEFYAKENLLTELDLSQLPLLKKLDLEMNQLTSLDLSANTELLDINLYMNHLSELLISNCIKLDFIECSSNLLKELDLSGCPKLDYLSCEENQLSSLDLSGNMGISSIYCSMNALTGLKLPESNNLTELECGSNQLTELDLSQVKSLEYFNSLENPELKTIWVWAGFNNEDYGFEVDEWTEFQVKE